MHPRRARRFLSHDLWTADLGTRPWPDRVRLGLLRLVVTVASEFRHGLLNLRAMGLVYTTLLSLVPFLAVAVSVLKAFGAHYQLESVLARVLAPLGPSEPEISRRLIGFVENLRLGVLGAAGIAGLFFTVISLLEKIEEALNHIWRVRRPRSFARRFTDYLSVVLVGPVLVFAAFALTASAESSWLMQRLLSIEPVGVLARLVGSRVMPFVIVSLALAFLYRVIPHTHVRLSSALIGGVTAGLLWQVSSSTFARFVAGSTQYTAMYSGFAILALFLLWLYVAWLVVLIGAEVGYFYQYPSAYLALLQGPSHRFREQLALSALVEVARRHLAGEPPWQAMELADALYVPRPTLEEVIDDFVRHGIVLRASEPEGLALARPPEQIAIVEILDALRDPDEIPLAAATSETVSALLRRRDAAVRDALGRLTLRSLATQTQEPGPELEPSQLESSRAA